MTCFLVTQLTTFYDKYGDRPKLTEKKVGHIVHLPLQQVGRTIHPLRLEELLSNDWRPGKLLGVVDINLFSTPAMYVQRSQLVFIFARLNL